MILARLNMRASQLAAYHRISADCWRYIQCALAFYMASVSLVMLYLVFAVIHRSQKEACGSPKRLLNGASYNSVRS